MAQLIVFLVICISLTPLVYFWVKGIDFMQKNHPDYKGDDLFGPFDEDDKDHVL